MWQKSCLLHGGGGGVHLRHENEYQGNGTKWYCFHTLSIRCVIVYIVAPFLPVRSYFEAGA